MSENNSRSTLQKGVDYFDARDLGDAAHKHLGLPSSRSSIGYWEKRIIENGIWCEDGTFVSWKDLDLSGITKVTDLFTSHFIPCFVGTSAEDAQNVLRLARSEANPYDPPPFRERTAFSEIKGIMIYFPVYSHFKLMENWQHQRQNHIKSL